MRALRQAMILLVSAALAAGACGSDSPTQPPPGGGGTPPPSGERLVPLTDLGTGRYLGRYEGGLYAEGRNAPPTDHLATGRERAARVRPLDRSGKPDPGGAYVLLSIGMSNASREFCGRLGTECDPGSFVDQARADPRVERGGLVIVNGAQGGETAVDWDSPRDPTFDRVRDGALAPLGLGEAQVQAVWLKQANPHPGVSLPSPDADAIRLERDLGEIVRALATRYPNLQLVFLSSRTYGGYAKTTLNPEPFAYESGFAVKWLVEAQIRQQRTGEIDPVAGDLSTTRGPWVGWGPYLWTDGSRGRSDGFRWLPADVASDGTHPSDSGVRKVGERLLRFFVTDPVARCWFVAGRDCGGA